jgi:hypothetical protein
MDFDAAVVVNKPQFSKFVHEETHPGPGRADHIRKRLLADFREDRLRFLVVLAKVRQQQEQPGQTFLTRIEQLIDKVTDRRIILKRGFIRRHTIEMNMQKVESVDVDQTLIGRLFNYGNVTIHGTGSSFENLRMIDPPLRLRTTVTAG